MLAFSVYLNGSPATSVNLSGAYVVGSDDVPLRADLSFRNGVIECEKRSAGPAGLALLWDVDEIGVVLTETVRLPERDKPYVLQVELARGRLMRISHKLEDWGLIDYPGTESIQESIQSAKELLIKALQADKPEESARFGDQALGAAVKASEALGQYHADVFLTRRAQTGGLPKKVFGCVINQQKPSELCRKRISAGFDFVTIPFCWRQIEATEHSFHWKTADAWVEVLSKQNMQLRGAPLLSFRESSVPDWLYMWEHDFDTLRDLAFEHIRRVLSRYGQYIHTWDVVSGIHGNNCFSFNFEQLMELTRMATALVKQAAPQALVAIEIVAPFGEYYSRNQRTIPPMLYADMVTQSGISFDAFSLQFSFGPAADGMYVRDMFQISSLLDGFAKLGKPLHISALQVPSDTRDVAGAKDGARPKLDGGRWHDSWSEQIQSEWFRELISIALSKPFVESVAWHELVDDKSQVVPYGGLLRSDLAPKQSYADFVKYRSELLGQTANMS